MSSPPRSSAASPFSPLKRFQAYVEANEWQVGKMQTALLEAETGDFASDEDVTALAKKWNVNAH